MQIIYEARLLCVAALEVCPFRTIPIIDSCSDIMNEILAGTTLLVYTYPQRCLCVASPASTWTLVITSDEEAWKYNHCCHNGPNHFFISHNNIFTFTVHTQTLNMQAFVKENICRAHVTASNNCEDSNGAFSVCFLPVRVAINRFVHACSMLFVAFLEWQKKRRSNDDENGNFSDAFFLHLSWLKQKYFRRKDFNTFSSLCRWLPPDPMALYHNQQCLSIFFCLVGFVFIASC